MGPKREEHSRFKGVCYSTSLAGVNDHGATNRRSADSPSQRVSYFALIPSSQGVTSKTLRGSGDLVLSFPPSYVVDRKFIQ